jgi:hypothetical protein
MGFSGSRGSGRDPRKIIGSWAAGYMIRMATNAF